MIGVIASSHPAWVVEEFFQLFKTPWEMWRPDRPYDVVISAGAEVAGDAARLVIVMGTQTLAMDLRQGVDLAPLARGAVLRDGDETLPLYGDTAALPAQPGDERLGVVDGRAVALRSRRGEHTYIRLGYDLFEETRRVLTQGQPVEHAATPTLDLQVSRLRRWMNDAELTFVEIPPVPHGHPFIVSLTHDIDFIGIRRHLGDHTMLGFLYRATLGSGRDFLRGRLAFALLCRNWFAAAKLPFVYLGLARDFWVPFPWLLEVEAGLPATYYLIPFKGRPGAKVKSAHPERRATGYDVADMPDWTRELTRAGCEIGVHGIDAWHDPAAGRAERERVAGVSGTPATGIRMHWLEFDETSYRVLEEAGYAYDTTMGFNETVGYRHGTAQVFRPPGAAQLLELPMHIQDGSLFYPSRLNLSGRAAHELCAVLVRQAERDGGVLTVLWHDRSHAPDRNWGDFYRELVAGLKQRGAWFASAAQAVNWFRQRRAARFVERDGQVAVEGVGSAGLPPFVLRLHRPVGPVDEPWTGAEARTVALPGAGVAELHAA